MLVSACAGSGARTANYVSVGSGCAGHTKACHQDYRTLRPTSPTSSPMICSVAHLSNADDSKNLLPSTLAQQYRQLQIAIALELLGLHAGRRKPRGFLPWGLYDAHPYGLSVWGWLACAGGHPTTLNTSGRWRVTGIRQSGWRPDTDSKSYKSPFSDCSPRPAEPAGICAASHWKRKYVYESGLSPGHP